METLKSLGKLLVIFCILGFIVLCAEEWKSGQTRTFAKAAILDPRDQQIKELADKVAELEAKPAEHHYELRNEGSRSFRFDPATGESCIQLASKADWKDAETMRQSCTYQDYFIYHREGDAYLKAECLYVGTASACRTLGWDWAIVKKSGKLAGPR